jgi:acetylglutamate kinase
MIVIKYGGHVLDESQTDDPIIKTIAAVHKAGTKIVVVHGGGPAINRNLEKESIEAPIMGGWRKTSAEAMQVVQSTLSGAVLRNLVNQFIAVGAQAVGLSTADGNTMRVKKFLPEIEGVKTDIGFVGEPSSVDGKFLSLIVNAGYLPILSSVATGVDGTAYNLNADIAAGAIAGALEADQVIFITDVPGIYRNWPDQDSLISSISLSEISSIAHTFQDGMAPKVKAVIASLESGAKLARVIDGTNPENLLAAIVGTGGTVVSK